MRRSSAPSLVCSTSTERPDGRVLCSSNNANNKNAAAASSSQHQKRKLHQVQMNNNSGDRDSVKVG